MHKDTVSRRDLAKYVAVGTGAAVFGRSSIDADDDAPEAPSPLDLTMGWLLERYPSDHLTDEQIAAIRRDVRRKQTQSTILRQFPLQPGDAPALVFSAYRAEV